MAHLFRNIVALGCFAGFAAVNGCGAQTGPEGSDQQDETSAAPTDEAHEGPEARHVRGAVDPDYCNIGPAITASDSNCANTVCNLIGDKACCTTAWSGNCVQEALAYCRSATFGGPVTCSCTHSVCTTGASLDYGCPGASTFVPQCVARVCSAPGMSYCCTGTWDGNCVTAAKNLCFGGVRCPG